MKYIVFSFGTGDYLIDEDNRLIVFESQGLAFQYIQENYHIPVPETKTKRMVHYPNYYQAPFRMLKCS